MLEKKIKLIEEQTSPLFRIMSAYNEDDPVRRRFTNNICAFHVGKGFVLSVAHNLVTSTIPDSVSETHFQEHVLSKINPALIPLFSNYFVLDVITNKRYFNVGNTPQDQQQVQLLINELNRIKFDCRAATLIKNKICKPFLIIQFEDSKFYNDPVLAKLLMESNRYFQEPMLNRHTFLVELELIEESYRNDVALYKMTNVPADIINKIPSIKIDYTIHDVDTDYYCIQGAPNDSSLGRLLNQAKVEGHMSHWSQIPDPILGQINLEGFRYLIKGYFRFGSSGAPYLIYDKKDDVYKVNAIQSEACPIQLSIGGNRNGHAQYINAIAVPLKNVQSLLEKHIN